MGSSSGRGPERGWGTGTVADYLSKYESRHAREVSEREAAGAVALAGCDQGAVVLDCPCGFGRHALALADRGYRVVGLDVSEAMLLEATRRARAVSSVAWVQADYRKLPFAGGSFDAALNVFTSFGFYGDEDDEAILAEFRRVLRPGGRLVLETTHRDRVVRSLERERRTVLDDGTVIVERRTFDVETGWLELTHAYSDRGEADRQSRARLRIYAVPELVGMLVRAGFREVLLLGGLDGRPLSTDSRLVAVATR